MVILKTEEELNALAKRYTFYCGVCKKETSMRRHGSYQGYLIDYSEGSVVNNRVTVPRLRCDECKTTHAVLLECYIPKGSYHKKIRDMAIRDYYNNINIEKICKKYEISVDLLYSWIHKSEDNEMEKFT